MTDCDVSRLLNRPGYLPFHPQIAEEDENVVVTAPV